MARPIITAPDEWADNRRAQWRRLTTGRRGVSLASFGFLSLGWFAELHKEVPGSFGDVLTALWIVLDVFMAMALIGIVRWE